MFDLAQAFIDKVRIMEPWLYYLLAAFVAALVLLGFASLFAGLASFVERRIAGRIMSRVGPNRVGPQGLFQFVADGVKLILKEDIIPKGADSFLFKQAPILVFAGMFGTFVVLPFGANLVAADLDVGLYYIIAITSLVVVGIILGGWSSNSKWALFGGLRSAAQIISYEIPVGLSLLVVVLISGSLSTQSIITSQGGLPWDWLIFHSPFSFIAFFIYFVGALAEGNRTPFDLPEAESELVAGYCTEYSGFRFVVFFFAEWANLWIMAAVAVICFLGGWKIPLVEDPALYNQWPYILLSFVVFSIKTLILVTVIIQLRWTLPRLRLDQMMSLCWKYLTPIAFVCIFGTMTWMLMDNTLPIVTSVIRYALFALSAFIVVKYFIRVRFNYMADRENYEKMTKKPLWYPPYRLP
jgi:NADH-quinone oxidoreductase subunit H